MTWFYDVTVKGILAFPPRVDGMITSTRCGISDGMNEKYS